MRNIIAVSMILLIILASGCTEENANTSKTADPPADLKAASAPTPVQVDVPNQWAVAGPIFASGPTATFDEAAVKDPSIVYYDNKWHMFYTAVSNKRQSIGYSTAKNIRQLNNARRFQLRQLRSETNDFAAAPQIFYFEPQKKWYLIFQTADASTQPVYSTNENIEDRKAWTPPINLLEKDEPEKWVDFWVICDKKNAYLFYTRDSKDVYVRTTSVKKFPEGFGQGQLAFSPTAVPKTEAVHVYKVAGRDEYHMFYETKNLGYRRYGLATATNLLGPWTRVTDDYATPQKIAWHDEKSQWTEDVSHSEVIRSGSDQYLEYDPAKTVFVFQGMSKDQYNDKYPSWPWKIGLLTAK